jgi:molybdate transport system substrate-binding protein
VKPFLRWASIVAVLGLNASAVAAQDLRVAVAANFSAPAQEIAASFERATGTRVELVSGSTGKLYAQISNGAPFDVLLAADEQTPLKLAGEGTAVPQSRFTYAIGKLVLWSPMQATVDARGDVLRTAGFRHLSLANPELAPYGAAAVAVMKRLGVYESLKPKLVQGENITQAHQFVATGAAELGFVALSQVLKQGRVEGSAWIIPPGLYPAIRQDAIILDRGKDKAAARQFLAYLRSEAAGAIIASYGYGHE